MNGDISGSDIANAAANDNRDAIRRLNKRVEALESKDEILRKNIATYDRELRLLVKEASCCC